MLGALMCNISGHKRRIDSGGGKGPHRLQRVLGRRTARVEKWKPQPLHSHHRLVVATFCTSCRLHSGFFRSCTKCFSSGCLFPRQKRQGCVEKGVLI